MQRDAFEFDLAPSDLGPIDAAANLLPTVTTAMYPHPSHCSRAFGSHRELRALNTSLVSNGDCVAHSRQVGSAERSRSALRGHPRGPERLPQHLEKRTAVIFGPMPLVEEPRISFAPNILGDGAQSSNPSLFH